MGGKLPPSYLITRYSGRAVDEIQEYVNARWLRTHVIFSKLSYSEAFTTLCVLTDPGGELAERYIE